MRHRTIRYNKVTAGGQLVKFSFDLKCYKCGAVDEVESRKVLPDEVVVKKFKERGWALGRRRDFDTCPTCMGVGKSNALASVFKVTDASGPVKPATEIVDEALSVREAEGQRILDIIRADHGSKASPDPTPAQETRDDRVDELIRKVDLALSRIDDVTALMELILDKVSSQPAPAPEPVRVPLESVGTLRRYDRSQTTYISLLRTAVPADILSDSVKIVVEGDRIKIRKSWPSDPKSKVPQLSSRRFSINTYVKGTEGFLPDQLDVETVDGGVDLVKRRTASRG